MLEALFCHIFVLLEIAVEFLLPLVIFFPENEIFVLEIFEVSQEFLRVLFDHFLLATVKRPLYVEDFVFEIPDLLFELKDLDVILKLTPKEVSP